MAKDSKNPLLEFAAKAAASASLAQAEQLTGIPFYQQKVERDAKKSIPGEAIASNSARLQAGLNTGIISKSFVDSYPGGFKALSESKEFDKTYGDGMRLATNERIETKAKESEARQDKLIEQGRKYQEGQTAAARVYSEEQKEEDRTYQEGRTEAAQEYAEGQKQESREYAATQRDEDELREAQLAWRAEGIKGEMPSTFYELMLGVADSQRKKLDNTDQNGRASMFSTAFNENLEKLTDSDNPNPEDLGRGASLLQSHLAILSGLDSADPQIIEVLKNNAIAATDKLFKKIQKRTSAQEISQSVVRGEYDWMRNISPSAWEDAMKIENVSGDMTRGNDILGDLATYAQSEPILERLRNSGNDELVQMANVAAEIQETGKFTMRTLGDEAPDLVAKAMGMNMGKFKVAAELASFQLNELEPAQRLIDEQLAMISTKTSSLLWSGPKPTGASLVTEEPGGLGKPPTVSGPKDYLEDFRRRKILPAGVSGAISTDDLRGAYAEIKALGDTASPLIQGILEPIETELVDRIRTQGYDPEEAAADLADDQHTWASDEVDDKLYDLVGEHVLRAAQKGASDVYWAARIDESINRRGFDTRILQEKTDNTRAREIKRVGALQRKDVFSQQLANRTLPDLQESARIGKTIAELERNITHASDNARKADLDVELIYRQAQLKTQNIINYAGPTIDIVMDALGTEGYVGTEKLFTEMLGGTGQASISLTEDGPTQPPAVVVLGALYTNLNAATTEFGRQKAFDKIMEHMSGPLSRLSQEAVDAGIIGADVLSLWERQTEINQSGQMTVAAEQLPKSDFDQVTEWSPLRDENRWKIQRQLRVRN